MPYPEWPAIRDRTAALIVELRVIQQRTRLGPAAWVKYAPEDWARHQDVLDELLALGQLAREHDARSAG